MRISILAVALLGGLVAAGCSNDHDQAARSAKTGGSVSAKLNLLPFQRLRPTNSQIAALPDRGELVAYDRQSQPLQRGAQTMYPVQLSEQRALRAITEGGMVIDAPDGHPVRLQYTRSIEHADGNWSWVGRATGDSRGSEAILTFGDKAVFGSIPNGAGEPLQLTTQGGRTWMVVTDRTKLVEPSAAARGADYMPEPASIPGTNTDHVVRASAARATLASPAQAAAVTTATPAATVDLLVGYTGGLATRLGGQSQVLTRLNFLVDVANQAYANSQVGGHQVRLVGAIQVNYPDATQNRATLFELSGEQCTNTSGAGQLHLPDRDVNCTHVTPPATLQPLLQAREQYRADLVSLIRDYHAENETCGVAWLIGGGQQAISADNASFGLSVVSDSNGGTCRNETLAHEMGHNMGLAHDRVTAAGSDDSNGDSDPLDPEEYGRFPYSFGYSTDVAGGNFYTIMAVPAAGQTSFRVFSNPRITICGGQPCGIANQADNALTLQQTMPLVAQFRTSTIARLSGDFNGDGKADILWHNTLSGRNTIYLSGNVSTQQAVTTVDNLDWSIVGVADFNGDHRSDILWRNVRDGRDAIWLSGNSSTQQTTTGVTTMAWVVVGSGDFNADGKADILWRNTTDGRNAIWLSGNNATQQAVASVTDQSWKIVGTGDFNGDGKADIVWRNSRDGRNTIWLAGSNATQQAVETVPSQDWEIRATGDFNGDGKSDLLWRNRVDGGSIIWRDGNYVLKQSVTAIDNFSWQIVGFGDFNGDHVSDVLWRNDSDGRNTIWLAANISTQQSTATVISQTWTVVP